MASPWREVPPTAGLPLHLADLRAGGELAAAAARFLEVEALTLTCSGSAALVIALTTLRRLSGRRKVIVPAYNCPLVAIAIAQCGLEVVPCDLLPESIDMDPVKLSQLCDAQTLAVMPTHLGGRVADVAAAQRIAAASGAWVIEDAAQAFGARTARGAVGTQAEIGFFSLAAGKGLTLYEGGLLHVRDAGLRAEMARTEAEIIPADTTMERRRCLELLGYAALYHPRGLPFVYGRPLRQALRKGDLIGAVGDRFPPRIPLHRVGRWRQGVGARALPRLAEFQAEGAARAAERISQLRQAGAIVLAGADPAEGSWPFFWLLMRDEAARDAALRQLWPAGLGVTRLFIHALPDYPDLAGIVPQASLPQARALAARGLTISNSPWLTQQDFERILAVLRQPGG